MKKIFKVIFLIFIAAVIIAIVYFGKGATIMSNAINKYENAESEVTKVDKSSVSYNGYLHTSGNQLLNQYNEPVQLRGVSSHGIEWYGDLITKKNLETLKDDWKTNVFRIAMYTDAGNNQGYVYNKLVDLNLVENVIDMCIDEDMYVIVDWHILTDNDPNQYIDESKDFFSTISKKYANRPNVIYEICNEPNGNVTWNDNVKPYAESVIPVIRENNKQSLVIVGTPNWCQSLDQAISNPLNIENVVYSCHFYAATHKDDIRTQVQNMVDSNLPVFVSECSMSDASGNGTLDFDSFNKWVELLNKYSISYVCWSLSNKNESSALLTPDYKKVSEDDLKDNEISSTIENSVDNSVENSTDVQEKKNIAAINASITNKTSTLLNSILGGNSTSNSTNSVIAADSAYEYPNMNDYLSESGKFVRNLFRSY